MIPIVLAALFAFPIPPLGATLGSGNGTPQTPVISKIEITQLPATGLATFYSPGVFELVLAVRGLSADGCPDCVGYAALLWPGDLGRVVCIQCLRLWVVDVASNAHRPGLAAKGWIVDLQWEVWQRLGFPNAPTKVEVTECEA